MFDPNGIPPVADDELLARFIVNSNEKRPDGTVHAKLFSPWKLVELSVNRHRDATMKETWEIASQVAKERGKTLYGLANIRARACRISPLNVKEKPLPGNPNHADIVGFPNAKEEQMSLAVKLAAAVEGPWIPAPAAE